MSDITGHAFSLSLSSTGGRLFGWGFDLYGSMTELDLLSYSSSEKYNLTLIYIGPSAVMSGNLNDKLRLDFVLGSGVACYTDNDHAGVGFGLKTTLGMEYMVSKKVGIGFDMLAITTIFGNPSGVSLPNNEVYGYRQLGLMLTGRFHF